MISGRPHADHLGIGQKSMRSSCARNSPLWVWSAQWNEKKPAASVKPPIKICMKSGFNCSSYELKCEVFIIHGALKLYCGIKTLGLLFALCC